MRSVGFTGTKQGMTSGQKKAVREFLHNPSIQEAHHGDCIGSDEEFHNICQDIGIPVILHPPIIGSARAFCTNCLLVYPPRQYLKRNKSIVNNCGHLLATPRSMEEELRSGTWSTVRYARKRGVPVTIIYP